MGIEPRPQMLVGEFPASRMGTGADVNQPGDAGIEQRPGECGKFGFLIANREEHR